MLRRVVAAALCAVLFVTVSAGRAGAESGVDVASYQHPNGVAIDWGQVRGAGHSFAYVKATEATTYTNPYFAGDWSGIANAGLLRGAYHYARPALPMSTAVDQARYFVSRTGSMQGGGDLPPMFDLEETGGLSAPDLVTWSHTWLNEVERLTGRRPVIYAGYYFWKDALGSTTSLSSYRLWLPQYNGRTAPNLVPSAWGAWSFWQHSSTGSVPGIIGNVDMNQYCCSAANLRSLAGGGSNAAASNPFGSLDLATKASGTMTLRGWAIDPDTTGPIKVHVYANGKIQGEFTAEATRADIGSAYTGWGPKHGYAVTIPAPVGDQRVCVYAINTGAGNANPELGCRTVTGAPVGTVDSVRLTPGGIRVEGWAFDPDSADSGEVHVYVNGVGQVVKADRARPDVASAFGLSSPNAGFRAEAVVKGRADVCVWAINKPSGANRDLGCRTLDVPTDVVGSFDEASVVAGGVQVRGWALDPDTASPVLVHVYDNGRFVGSARANGDRGDIAQVYPLFGAAHGFTTVLPNMANGSHQICAYAMSIGPGQNPLLSCRTLTVTGAPNGSFDGATLSNGVVRVRGWTFDPDAKTTPLTIRITIDGGAPVTATANASRADVGAAFAGVGNAHGFDTSVTLGSGGPADHQVCITAVGVGAGPGTFDLGCRTVSVAAPTSN